jgi:putative PIN family toxin of toxin-antitoxin system
MPQMGTGVLPPNALRDAAYGSTTGIKMAAPRVVLDTNVLVAAARSRLGASFALVSSIPAAEFQPCLSVGLYAEWQEVLTRPEHLQPGQTVEDALGFVRYLASQSHLQEIHFLWRPFLADADDDMVLELAFAAGCGHIITHNVKDFRGSDQFGVAALSPREFLKLIGKNP